MKRILWVWLCGMTAPAAFSQGAVIPVHINYDLSDKDLYGSSYDHVSYALNARRDTAAIGMLFTVCDTFPDRISGNFYSKHFLPALRLDSIRVKINHTRTSSRNDTLVLGLAGSANGIFPDENTFYGDSIVLTSSYAPGRSYASAKYLTIPVGVYVPISFTASLLFLGSPGDTLRVWSGYGYDGLCGQDPNRFKGRRSHFFPDAFAYRKEFGQLLPTFSGEDIFVDCDQVPGFDSLADGYNTIQNWDMDFFLTATTAGLEENVLADSPLLYPNPGRGTFYLALPGKRVTVFSLSGKEMWQGKPDGNSVYLPLPSGFYLVRLETDAGTRIEKLIISE